jgi:hypothetical protein
MQLSLHRAYPIQIPVTKKVEGVELQKIQDALAGYQLTGIGRDIGKRKDRSVDTLALQQREQRLDSTLMKRTGGAAAKAALQFDGVQFESPPPTRFDCRQIVMWSVSGMCSSTSKLNTTSKGVGLERQRFSFNQCQR